MALGSSKPLCSHPADVDSEPLAGSGVKKATEFFIVLEHRGSWGSHVAATPVLPDPATGEWLDQQRRRLAVEGDAAGGTADNVVRSLFIRRVEQAADAPLNLFVAQSSPAARRLFRLQVESYDQLHGVDLLAVLRGEVVDPHSQRLILVCTHQERDKCCAAGEAVYRQLQMQGEREVWGSSHLGGHRYAPTLLVLPEGSLYGRIGKQDPARLVAAWQRGELLLDRLRGRTWFGPAAQAADVYLRRQLDCPGACELSLVAQPDAAAAGDRVEVILQRSASGETYRVELEVEAGPLVLASCGPPMRFIGQADQRWTAESSAQPPQTRPLRFRARGIARVRSRPEE